MKRVSMIMPLRGIPIVFTFLSVLGILLTHSFFKASPVRGSSPAPQAVTWPSVTLTKIAGGLNHPTSIVDAGDLSARLFVTEQPGTIKILQNGAVQSAAFLDIRDRVQYQAGSEQGLLGLAFPPNYASKGYFYVYYTQKDWTEVVSRFKITSANKADPNSELKIIVIPHPSTYSNHNGGEIQFGPDGYLYIGTGDGGGGGDPNGNGQNLGTTLAKILRIDVESRASVTLPAPRQTLPFQVFLPLIDSTGGAGSTYLIPPDNPFIGKSGAAPEIWAYGVRNPWRFSFDTNTGDLYIADVGQDQYEEVDFQPAGSKGGENYGWNIMEGMHCYNSANCNQTGLTLPVLEYAHGANDSTGCAITGGYVYRGLQYATWQGFYFFSDYCSGTIWAATNVGGWSYHPVLDTNQFVSTFGQDQQGNLYLADGASGDIFRLAQP